MLPVTFETRAAGLPRRAALGPYRWASVIGRKVWALAEGAVKPILLAREDGRGWHVGGEPLPSPSLIFLPNPAR